MTNKGLMALISLGSLLSLISGSVGLSQIRRLETRRITGIAPQLAQPINQTQVRVLEGRIARLPATDVVKSTDIAGNTPPVQPAAPSPIRPQLQYVPTDAAIEHQLTSALAAQTGIQKLVGKSGVILPFPGMIRQVEQTGEEIQLKAYALAGKRLRYDAAHRMFNGSIWLGVSEIVAGRSPRKLVAPVDFEVLDADFAQPSRVRVWQTGSPLSIRLGLAAAVEGGGVKVVSNLTAEPISLDLPLNPELMVEPGNSTIEGLGLGTTEINVSVVGLPNPKNRTVTLHTSSGYLKDTNLRLDENGTASTRLRSDNLGPATINAMSPGLARATAPIDYRLPYISFSASIVGGLVGGIISIGTSRRRKVVLPLLVSVLVGLLVSALYAVGVNVLPVTPTVTVGALLVFAVSGLGAFLGPRVLKGA